MRIPKPSFAYVIEYENTYGVRENWSHSLTGYEQSNQNVDNDGYIQCMCR